MEEVRYLLRKVMPHSTWSVLTSLASQLDFPTHCSRPQQDWTKPELHPMC